ncbi:phosphoenolpyruvate hydrolase family protein [Paenibacillus arenilitoris]|uniref:Phosphoenolpyruvate hydrolase family protein n=1 Tax=Paenibacillus arenilitoris TaxID=2772299 RepID=A0A927CV82_9BACL|nr:phosphoenolpyruvate hydrolase family protein [Paenibacillus arenilitoris]MBD2872826.1 phosphoenolpyruvate hydrolase family protein [Paenibacillus arenilitoris]
MQFTREQVLERLKNRVAAGLPIIGAGAGAGISAKSAEAGGIDLIIIYNSGRFRMAGRGSVAGMLPYGDANQIVVEMGAEVLPVVKETPVLAGVCGTDPFRDMPRFLKQIKEQGFSGVQNYPTVAYFEGAARQDMEDTGFSYDLEVEMIGLAREMDLFTAPYVYNEEEATKMAKAGADMLVAHMGLTAKGSIGAKNAQPLDACVAKIEAIRDAARAVNPEALVICHGGPISEPADLAYILSRVSGLDGFFGASSIERLATERAIRDLVIDFKQVSKPLA